MVVRMRGCVRWRFWLWWRIFYQPVGGTPSPNFRRIYPGWRKFLAFDRHNGSIFISTLEQILPPSGLPPVIPEGFGVKRQLFRLDRPPQTDTAGGITNPRVLRAYTTLTWIDRPTANTASQCSTLDALKVSKMHKTRKKKALQECLSCRNSQQHGDP